VTQSSQAGARAQRPALLPDTDKRESTIMLVPSRLPKTAGVGFKMEHYCDIISDEQAVGFFEVHAENYMGAGGPAHMQLRTLRERYALSIHGVGLSIGSMGPLDRDHLCRLDLLCRRYQPESFSEHLAWSSHSGTYYNDLLPLPYSEETLAQVVDHVDEVQTTLAREVLIENPATYIRYAESTIPEGEFLAELSMQTGCGLLLDVNNVFVQAANHGTFPNDFLSGFPLERVKEIHLAGHEEQTDDSGRPLLIDTHGSPVSDPVWSLYRDVIARTGPLPTLIEWDNNVPAWSTLLSEAIAAQTFLERTARSAAA
jgi:uncharacterized protein (UPF0276 family)